MNHAGAIASNAGDDFHLIWAGKKVLEMLKPNSELDAVVVEGPALKDSIMAENQSLLYSIDITNTMEGKIFVLLKKLFFHN